MDPKARCFTETTGLIDVAATLGQHEILLTGGNGFLGKILLALLLDRYPGLKHLHLLLRPRGDRTAEERFAQEVLASPPLEAIVEKRGQAFLREKVTVWPGDAAQPDCGVTSDGWAGDIGLILNCAGLVEFFAPLDQSLQANVDSVEHLCALAERVGAKLLHVSTCYVAGECDGLVEETEPIDGFYPHRAGVEDVSFDAAVELEECRRRIGQIRQAYTARGRDSDGKSARELTDRLVELGRRRAARWGWVNTYTYTKSLGEQVLASRDGLDFTIVRPAIVESSLRFPFPGWIEGGRTSAPLLLMALGGMTDWPARGDIPLEVVPVDQVASAIVIAGALLLNGRHESVYQLGSADVNPFGLEPLIELLCREARKSGPNGSRPVKVPFWLQRRSKPRLLSEQEARIGRERLRRRLDKAQAMAAALRGLAEQAKFPGRAALGKWAASLRTFGLQINFREQTLEQYLPFIQRNRYIFEAHNIRAAYEQITQADRRRLPWDPETIDWTDYWTRNQIEGIRKWIQPEAVRDWSFKI